MVGNHLYERGFMDFYFIWTSHGEQCGYSGEASTSNIQDHVDEGTNSPVENMIHDEYQETNIPYGGSDENVFEEPSGDASIFFKRLEDAQQPIYEGCAEGLSGLSLSSRLMNIKTDHNLSEVCMNAICDAFTDYLPANNRAPESYYEIKKLTWYKPKAEGGGKNIPYQRMFYMPIGDRLKHLYQSERTASHMRWHAEHLSPEGEMHHPSDGEAWKHVQKPLIEELKDLWTNSINTYDVSKKQNFVMRAVLMWTISDFPAYGMFSGWMTHGRLACPYCLEETESFWLRNGRKQRNGRKHSWFDCHRKFLHEDHPYRRNVRSFTKNRSVRELPPSILSGEEVLYERINQIDGLKCSVVCGGNGHIPRDIDGYGDYHNWIKKSIFWEFPYWENQLLRHNLDVMHIEKNYFDNIMNTVLNVPGKTKDNLKSRLDLPLFVTEKD
ncbi:uncharacterized protein LOC106454022 [Brassica napus]|uniref:uncharacterized protein LOC106454022 n=1 Tax=Brassica napus TaxID=3708 RepID=UPI0006AB5238|nr:uncharacterized protein LOC106454022 [Brassica napus]